MTHHWAVAVACAEVSRAGVSRAGVAWAAAARSAAPQGVAAWAEVHLTAVPPASVQRVDAHHHQVSTHCDSPQPLSPCRLLPWNPQLHSNRSSRALLMLTEGRGPRGRSMPWSITCRTAAPRPTKTISRPTRRRITSHAPTHPVPRADALPSHRSTRAATFRSRTALATMQFRNNF